MFVHFGASNTSTFAKSAINPVICREIKFLFFFIMKLNDNLLHEKNKRTSKLRQLGGLKIVPITMYYKRLLETDR